MLTRPTFKKRKAQNRAAQRAFRERKEKHLKDLETKVEELQKASENASNENSQLRARIETMTAELNEYKKRMSLVPTSRSNSQGPTIPWGSAFISNINDVNFQFESPKFGVLPGPQPTKQTPAPAASATTPSAREKSSNNAGPASQARGGANTVHFGNENRNSRSQSQISIHPQATQERSVGQSSADFSMPSSNNNGIGDLNGAPMGNFDSNSSKFGPTTTSSPSASSNSNMGGQSSSCATSPEPYNQSPMGFKQIDTLTTIGEEQSGGHQVTHGKTQLDGLKAKAPRSPLMPVGAM